MKTIPLWKEGIEPAAYPPLAGNLKVDVLVIGGGITGVTSTLLLAQAGKSVALAERFRLGGRDTGHTTAHLTYMTDTRLSQLVHVCGESRAKVAWQAGLQAMDQIRELSTRLQADAGLVEVPGYLVAAEDDPRVDTLRKEAEIARMFGFDAEFIEDAPPTGRPGIRFPNQLKFHPLRYLHALAVEATKLGARIHEHTDVEGFDGNHVTANGFRIGFDHVVVATHVPLKGTRSTLSATLFQTKLASYSTYAVAAKIPGGIFDEMIWSDTAEPFNYLRVDQHPDHDIAILGGGDHKTGQIPDNMQPFPELERFLGKISPDHEITHRWTSQVVETIDGLPYIGQSGRDEFIATGFSGNGMTFGTLAAMMARDWVTGRSNPWERVFDPGRFELSASATYLTENSDFPVHMIRDRIGTTKGMNAELEPGQGRILKHDGHHAAVCKGMDGNEHRLSAVCPHMGCIVAWNESANTWDCPCHGSRFLADGTVIAGPAESNLEPMSTSDRNESAREPSQIS
jgi:glycine/D-amino acid oxidase-like deaminating enzyme/nitrite reductase/ring-hydroxylating ferredoxin subunit